MAEHEAFDDPMAEALPIALAAEMARQNHGLVTRTQLSESGMSDHNIATLVSDGVVIRRSRGVYSLVGNPQTWEQQVALACKVIGDSTVAGARSAATIWGFQNFHSRAVDVVTPWPATRTRIATDLGFAVNHRISRDLLPAHVTQHAGLPVTCPARTLIDMGACVGAQRLRLMIDDAVSKDLTTYDEVFQMLLEVTRPGRRGLAVVRKALEFRPVGGQLPRSVFDAQVLQLIMRAALPEPVRQHPVICDDITYHLDLAWPQYLIAIECDGFQFHRTPDRMGSDQERMKELNLRGWMIHRVTWQMLKKSPEAMIDDFRRSIALRSTAA